jgi:hypothetical protein
MEAVRKRGKKGGQTLFYAIQPWRPFADPQLTFTLRFA